MIFKRKSKLILTVCVIFVCTIFVSSAAGAGQPGSDLDPIVTKSYVDKQISSLSALLKSGTSSPGTGTGTVDTAAVAQLQTDVGDLTKFVIDALAENGALKARIESLENGYAVVEAKAGRKIQLSGGSEAILRSGSAVAVKGVNGDLMIDASAGVDIKDGASVSKQHILISSRTDGRGLLIKTDSFLLIRGAYTIK